MKHADAQTLDRIEDILLALREIPGLKERKRGIFYRKSQAFIHFHQENNDIYADARLGGDDFSRYPVTSELQQAHFLDAVRAFLHQPS